MTKDGFLELLPKIREAARTLGYAVGLHGTLARDYDLMAVPWAENAANPDDLAEAIKEAAGCVRWRVYRGMGISREEAAKKFGVDVEPEYKPHGRLVYCFDWDKKNYQNADYIDLSVMPPKAASFAIDDFKERAKLMDECFTCKCGSVAFHVLKSYQIECSNCGVIKEMPFDTEVKGA